MKEKRWKSFYQDLREAGHSKASAEKTVLLKMVNEDEEEQRELIDYDDRHIRQAIVHVRQDIILMVSDLSSISKTLKHIKILLVSLFIIAAYAVITTIGKIG